MLRKVLLYKSKDDLWINYQRCWELGRSLFCSTVRLGKSRRKWHPYAYPALSSSFFKSSDVTKPFRCILIERWEVTFWRVTMCEFVNVLSSELTWHEYWKSFFLQNFTETSAGWKRPMTVLFLELAWQSVFCLVCCLSQARRSSIWTGTSTTAETLHPWLPLRTCSPSLGCQLQIRLSMVEVETGMLTWFQSFWWPTED